MSDQRSVLGIFQDKDRVLATLKALRDTSWTVQRVFSPFPLQGIAEALHLKTSPVGWFTLGGAVIGFVGGFLISIYTASEWKLIVSGKPVIAWIPFLIVAFEFTVLFAVFGTISGLLIQSRLPEFEDLKHHDPRCSGEHFGILVSCPEGEEGRLTAFFEERGAESKPFDTQAPHDDDVHG